MKKVFKIIFIVALAAILVALAFWLIPYFSSKDPHKSLIAPRIRKAGFSITEFSAKHTTLKAHVLIENPAVVDLVADSVTYKFFVQDVFLGESKNEKQIRLRSKDTTWVYLETNFSSHRLFRVLDSLAKKHQDSVSYTVKAVVYNKIKNFDVDRNWYGPLFHPVSIKTKDVKFDSLRHKHAYVGITLLLGNENDFPLSFKDINYRVSLDGGPWLEGHSKSTIKLEPHHTVQKNFPVTVPLKNAGSTGLKLLFKKEGLPYRMKLTFVLNSDHEVLKNSKVSIDDSSTIGNMLDLMHK